MFEMHTNYRNFRWQPYLRALNKGWKISPVGSHDNHSYDNIENPDFPPPTLVLATELSRTGITRAMKERRTYVTWIDGVELRYSVNGYIMGSTLDSPGSYDFQIEIRTPSGNDNGRVRRIQIVRDHPEGIEDVVVAAEMEFDGTEEVIAWNPTIEDDSAKYFLLRVHHASDINEDGNYSRRPSTISGPVWTGM